MHRQADSKSLEPGQRVFDNDLPVTTHSRGLHRSDSGTHCQAEIRDVGPPNVSILHRLRPTRVVRQGSRRSGEGCPVSQPDLGTALYSRE